MPKIGDLYGPRPALPGEGHQDVRSMLPPGGSPMTDQDFMAWLERTCERANRRYLDSFPHGTLPDRELASPWQLLNHLYKWVIGWPFPSGTGPTRAHRIRFLGSYYSVRPTLFRVEAARYLDGLAQGASGDDRG